MFAILHLEISITIKYKIKLKKSLFSATRSTAKHPRVMLEFVLAMATEHFNPQNFFRPADTYQTTVAVHLLTKLRREISTAMATWMLHTSTSGPPPSPFS